MNLKNINKIFAGLLILSLIGFTSCEKQEVVKIIGFIQGHTFDGNTNAPLDNVKVIWSVAGKKDSTVASADEGYLISNLPSGEYSIWCSKESYTTVVVDRSVPISSFTETVKGGANKEYVITYNPNLYPLNAGLTGRLYKNENGVSVPVSGATVQLDYNTLSAEDAEYYRFIPALYEATTDANGYYTFTNVPATDVIIRFLDFTDTNDETYYDDYSHGTSSRRIYLHSGKTYAFGVVNLIRVADAIKLTNTNVYASSGIGTTEFDIASDITLTFNKDVHEANTLANGNVSLQAGGVDVASTVTFAGNVITINPDENLSPNTQYIVSYSVYSSQAYDVTTSNVSFKTADKAVIPAQVTGFVINYNFMGTGWTADYNTTSVWFTFNSITEATSYEIYARDNYNNSDYVWLETFNQIDYVQGPYNGIATLPAKFDYYKDDGVQTPFSHGTTVSYKVRAVNSAGAGPFSDILPITDQTSFTSGDMDLFNQSASADNSAGVTALTFTVDLNIFSGRYADVATDPSFGIYDGSGTLITGASFAFSWTNHQNGVVTVTVPAGTDYSIYDLRAWGVKDSSGNTMDAADFETHALN